MSLALTPTWRAVTPSHCQGIMKRCAQDLAGQLWCRRGMKPTSPKRQMGLCQGDFSGPTHRSHPLPNTEPALSVFTKICCVPRSQAVTWCQLAKMIPSHCRGYRCVSCETIRYLVTERCQAETLPSGPSQSLLGCSLCHRRHLLPRDCVVPFHWIHRGRETAVKISYLKLLKLHGLLWNPLYGILFIFYLF